MALIDCPECKKQISNHAVFCAHCGMPLVCPECGHKHAPLEAPALNLPRPSRRHLMTAVVFASSLVAWALVAFGLWKYFEVQSEERRAVSAPPVAAHAVPATPESVLAAAPMPSTAESPETAAPQPTLSFAGSEVLGSNLVPSLAEAYRAIHGVDPSGPAWESYKAVARAVGNGGKSIMIHSDAPAAARTALARAIETMIKDPEYLKTAEKVLEGYGFNTGERLDANIAAIGRMDAASIDWLRELLSREFKMKFK